MQIQMSNGTKALIILGIQSCMVGQSIVQQGVVIHHERFENYWMYSKGVTIGDPYNIDLL